MMLKPKSNPNLNLVPNPILNANRNPNVVLTLTQTLILTFDFRTEVRHHEDHGDGEASVADQIHEGDESFCDYPDAFC